MSVEATTTVNNSNNNGKRKHAKVDNEIDPKQALNPEADPYKDLCSKRWKHHLLTDSYVQFTGNLMYPTLQFGPYGYNSQKGRFPVEQVNTVGLMLNPFRKKSSAEKWSPVEIAVFEGSLTLYGKNFHRIQKDVQTKTTKEIIEFYYDWKKSSHYKEWKKTYIR